MKVLTAKTTRTPRQKALNLPVLAVLVAQALLPLYAQAAEAAPGDGRILPPIVLKSDDGASLTIKGTITYGTTIRARSRDAELLPAANAARVGASGTAPGGVNVDDGNLNYDKGDHISTALKGIIDLELKYTPNLRAFVRVRAWEDQAQRKDAVPHGNLPNNYVANTPLGDGGFSGYGQFSGAVLMDAYVEGRFDLGKTPLSVRLGSQIIEWGRLETTILGGLEQINAIDYAARYRAGALHEESFIPVPAVFARLGNPRATALEAFYLLRYHENELGGCGTFFGFADYASDGCDKVLAHPVTLTDPAAIAAGLFARRGPDVKPSHGGQYGIAATHVVEGVGRFGAYFANYHSRRFSPSAIRSPRLILGATPLIPGDPGGQNVRYFIEYPENIRVFGLNYGLLVPDGRWKGAGIYAEYTYRPNQSILLGSTDLFNAFASNVAPTQLRADATATPPGGVYHGFDRRKISQFLLMGGGPLGNALGGALTVGGEAGFKYIHDLPDVNVRRYGRSDVYGFGPVNGVCPPGATSKQCSSDGFVSAFSWGYRAKVSMRYADVINGIDLIPSVGFQHDVKGWSHDIIFLEGRKAATVSLRAEFKKSFFAEASWSPIWGGDYNFTKDRDIYAVTTGMRF